MTDPALETPCESAISEKPKKKNSNMTTPIDFSMFIISVYISNK